MQLPTSLALSFLQLADRRGNGDGKVSAQELAAITIAYGDERQKLVTAGNTQLAASYEPYIQLGTTAFFGGKDHKGLVPDFNGDKLIDLQTEAVRLDADRNGTIDSKDYQTNFGAAVATGGNPVTAADIESLRQIAMGQQFASPVSPVGATPPPGATPPVNGAPPVPGTAPVNGAPPPSYTGATNALDGMNEQQMLMMTMGLVMMATLMSGLGGQLPSGGAIGAKPPVAPGTTTPAPAPTNGLPPTPGSMPRPTAGGVAGQPQPSLQQLLPMLMMALLQAFGMGGTEPESRSSQLMQGMMSKLPTAGSTTPKTTMASQLAQQNFANQASQYAG
jgi:hypothetical protein